PTLAEMRERGVPPERLLGLLAGWAGLGDGSSTSLGSLVPRFALQHLPREPIQGDASRVHAALFGGLRDAESRHEVGRRAMSSPLPPDRARIVLACETDPRWLPFALSHLD